LNNKLIPVEERWLKDDMDSVILETISGGEFGGQGSGYHGHKGRIGKVGGSAPDNIPNSSYRDKNYRFYFKSAKRFLDSLGDDQKSSLEYYADGLYSMINNYLRGKNSPETYGGTRYGSDLLIDNLDEAFNNDGSVVSENIKTYRGIPVMTEDVEEFTKLIDTLEVGGTFEDKAYFSSSMSKKVAGNFAGLQYDTRPYGNIMFEVEVPKGSRALYPSLLNADDFMSPEQEILLPRGSKFEILSKVKTKEGDYFGNDRYGFPDWYIKMRLLP